jgi:hypothetical protein
MTLEIIKEEKFNEATWYGLKVNGSSFQYSRKLEEIEQLYEELKNNPDLINTKITVLKSEQV